LLGGAPELLIEKSKPPLWPEGLERISATQVRDFVSKTAGARPWDRDAVDVRIVAQALSSGGKIIDSEVEVGGYPQLAATRAAFDPNAWDLDCLVARGRAP
jgi:hypothetical protein